MSRLWVWWVALGVWVTVSVWVHLFYIKRVRLSTEPVLPPVRIIDRTQLRIQLPGSLFHQAGSEMRSLGNRSALDTLAAYLMANPRRLLTITGYNTPAESKQTLIQNLGAVRALGVLQYLLTAGVPEDQVQSWGKTSESLLFVQDSTSALSFSFQSVRIDANWLARHQKYIDLFHPLQLYFPTGSTEYIHTPDNERFASEAIAYLRDHRREQLVITGHTDSVGTAARNLQLSQLRAMAVRDKLMQQGAAKKWFRIVAQGDKAPIASNALPEGREANRRVTLLVERR
jgi:OOP family OmpA-OmpF porin